MRLIRLLHVLAAGIYFSCLIKVRHDRSLSFAASVFFAELDLTTSVVDLLLFSRT